MQCNSPPLLLDTACSAIDKLLLCKRMTVEIDLRCKFYWGGCATVRQSARLRTVLDYLQQCDLKLETHCKVWVALCKRVAYLKVAFSNSRHKRETRNRSRRRRRPGAAATAPLPAPSSVGTPPRPPSSGGAWFPGARLGLSGLRTKVGGSGSDSLASSPPRLLRGHHGRRRQIFGLRRREQAYLGFPSPCT